MVSLIFGAAVLAWGISLGFCGRALKQRDPMFNSVALALLLLALTLLPRLWVDLLVPGLLALLIGLVSRNGWGIVVAVILFGAGSYLMVRFMPGGGSAFVIACALLGIAIAVPRAVRLRRRLARARQLRPGDAPSGLVEIGGRAQGEQRLSVSGVPRVAAFWVEAPNLGRRAQPRLLPVQTDAGTVLVDLEKVDVDLAPHRTCTLTPALKAELSDLLESSPPDASQTEGQPAGDKSEDERTLGWLENGAELYLIGVPDWEPDPTGGAGYRGAGPVPVFRSRPGEPARVVEGTEAGAIARSRWSLVQLFAWTVASVASLLVRLLHR